MQSAEPRNAHPTRLWPIAGVALAGVALFQFFGNANLGYIKTRSLFYWWGFQWSDPASESEHGWLILGLAGWLLWRNLRGAHQTVAAVADRGSGLSEAGYRSASSRSPLLILLAALALHAIGFVVQQARVSILAFLLFTWGLTLLYDTARQPDGPTARLSRAAAFPLAFMVFAIPLNVLDSIGFWLRMGVIRTSAAIAHTFGIGVLRSGTLLLAPDGRYQYDVAAACSGVRSLMALAALSLLLGYISLNSRRLRALVFLACFPLVFLGNVARITAIIFAAQWGGATWGDRAHDVMGWGVFVIVLGGVYGLAAWVRRWDPSNLHHRDTKSTKDAQSTESVYLGALCDSVVRSKIPFGVIVLVAIEMAGLNWVANQPARGEAGVRLAADGVNPVDLPASLNGGEWFGRVAAVTQVEREVLPPDTGYSRRQYVPLGRPEQAVLLSIVLSGRDRTSIHRPELCLVGQGWTINGATVHQFRDPTVPGRVFTAAILQVEREVVDRGKSTVVPQLVAYWFVSSEATVSSHWARIARDVWSRLVHLRADRWAYVLLQTNAEDGEDAALARMQTVLNATLPVFHN